MLFLEFDFLSPGKSDGSKLQTILRFRKGFEVKRRTRIERKVVRKEGQEDGETKGGEGW